MYLTSWLLVWVPLVNGLCLVNAQTMENAIWRSPRSTAKGMETYTEGAQLNVQWRGWTSPSAINGYETLVDLYVRPVSSNLWVKRIAENINITTAGHFNWDIRISEDYSVKIGASFLLYFQARNPGKEEDGESWPLPSPYFKVVPEAATIADDDLPLWHPHTPLSSVASQAVATLRLLDCVLPGEAKATACPSQSSLGWYFNLADLKKLTIAIFAVGCLFFCGRKAWKKLHPILRDILRAEDLRDAGRLEKGLPQ